MFHATSPTITKSALTVGFFSSLLGLKLATFALFGQLAPLSGDLLQTFFRVAIGRAWPVALPLSHVGGIVRLLTWPISSLLRITHGNKGIWSNFDGQLLRGRYDRSFSPHGESEVGSNAIAALPSGEASHSCSS
jgi:hypothetical protein